MIATAFGADDRDATKERARELQKNAPKTDQTKKSGKGNKATAEEKNIIDEGFSMDLVPLARSLSRDSGDLLRL